MNIAQILKTRGCDIDLYLYICPKILLIGKLPMHFTNNRTKTKKVKIMNKVTNTDLQLCEINRSNIELQ